MTQKQVAEQCKLSKSVYSRYESGERNPSIKAAQKLARALDCTIDDLLRDSEEAEPVL
ncbi:MAG: helix-turn-helix transcriptional regulator [Anaerolineaceae bacterium]|nr:helix-turn-helix transcriptional regulator [Anaerolineaceae bacterium]